MRVRTNKRESTSSQTQTLKQFVLILCCVLSLLASSVSACICSHHQEKAKTETPSCHNRAADDAEQTKETGSSTETTSRSVTEGDACCCAQPAPKIFTKSESVKSEKQTAALQSATAAAAFVFAAQVVPAQNHLSKPLYLTDSFYNLSPGRAPPRL